MSEARIVARTARPAPASAVSAATTLGWRALLKIKHIPFQLFDVTATPIMFTLLFTFVFGGELEGSTAAYADYVIPGILVQSILFITVYTGVGLNTDISKGLFDRFRSLPIWQPSPIFGALLGDVLRYTVVAVVVVSLGLLLGFRADAGILGVLAAVGLVLVFAFALSWIWIIVSMFVKTPESVMTTSFLLLFPLTFVSNVFVRPDNMPGWLQTLVYNNPVTHLADASRGLMDGNAAATDVFWVLGAAALLTAVFAPIALRLYHKER